MVKTKEIKLTCRRSQSWWP